MLGKYSLLAKFAFWIVTINSYPVGNVQDCVDYLARFGYITKDAQAKLESYSFAARRKVSQGLEKFQYFAALPQTGMLDRRTIHAMNKARCGNSELEKLLILAKSKRNRRFVLDSRWEKIFLTYKILNGPTNGPNLTTIANGIQKAFSFWTNEGNVHIVPVKNSVQQADIEISFVRGPHNDGIEFDEVEGVGKVIAHAWKPFNSEPLRGDMHFNDEVKWSNILGKEDDGFDFLRTATHEAGHALGLEHSPHQDAMMFYAVTGFLENGVQLSKDDKKGIQVLYGRKLGSPTIPSNQANDTRTPSEQGNRPVIVPSGVPAQNIPWECYRLQELIPKNDLVVRLCYQNFWRDVYRTEG